MVGKYGITEDEVRNYQGLNDQDIGEAPIQDFILQAEEEAEDITHQKWVPTQEIERKEGHPGKRLLMLDNRPVTQVLQVRRKEDESNFTDLDPNNLEIQNNNGRIVLTENAEENTWNTQGLQRNIIKYSYADMNEDQTALTDTVSSNSSGDTVVEVEDSSLFSDDDYVKIHGIDGNEEIVQVSSTTTGSPDTITVEELQIDHTSGSSVVLMTPPETALNLIKVLASIRVAAYKIGGTQDFQSSYNLGDLEVTKGEPYPPFKQLLPEFKNERDFLVNKLKSPVIK
jgi:hypothetical protein